MTATIPRSRRRSLIRAGVVIALCLAFGAVVNFGVMWWCMRGIEREKRRAFPFGSIPSRLVPAFVTPPKFYHLPREWTVKVPGDWPRRPNEASGGEFGWLYLTSEKFYQPREKFNQPTARFSRMGTVHRAEVGWPLRCWWGAERSLRTIPPSPRAEFAVNCLDVPIAMARRLGVSRLPIGIHPLPFIANTLIYAAIPMGLWLAIGPLRRWRRRRAGRCTRCGYNRAGLAAGAVCPECGHASAPAVHPPRPPWTAFLPRRVERQSTVGTEATQRAQREARR